MSAAAGSMPSTLNESTPNSPPPKPPSGASPSPAPRSGTARPPVPPSEGAAGSSPANVVFVRLSAPAAPATPSVPSTVPTTAASRVPRRMSVMSRDWLSVVEPSAFSVPPSSPNSKEGRPPSPGSACAPVTVRSVPTP